MIRAIVSAAAEVVALRRGEYAVLMSILLDRDAGETRLEDEDDWFAPPPRQAHARRPEAGSEGLQWESELDWEDDDSASPDFRLRQAAAGLAVVVAVFLVVAGVLIGRATKSSTTKVVTVTAALPVQQAAAPTGTGAGNSATTSTDTAGSTGTPNTSGTTSTGSVPAPSSSTSTGGSSSGSSAGANSVPTDATLRVGTNDPSVTALQKALTALGYTAGTADGNYGATTAQAVTAFQNAKGLVADGIAGAQTLAAINAAIATG